MRINALFRRIIQKARSSEYSRWGTYKSKIQRELHTLNYPGFKAEAFRREAKQHGRWKALRQAEVRQELQESASKFTKWWWQLPPRYRIGSGITLGLVSAFGLKTTTAIIHGGQRLLFHDRPPDYIERAYNRMEGMVHTSEERSDMRGILTDFGSGWQHGTTIRLLRSILKERRLTAQVSGHAAHVGKAVWLERIGKEQVSYWPGRLSGIMNPRADRRGIVFNFPSWLEKTEGANIHSAKGILRIHKDIPLRLADSVVVPSHVGLWQRIFENTGLGHIRVRKLMPGSAPSPSSIGLVETTAIQPRFNPPPAPLREPGRIVGARYDEVKAAMSGSEKAKKLMTIRSLTRQRQREIRKLVPHNRKNAALIMHDMRVKHQVVDDIGKTAHLFGGKQNAWII